MPAKSANVEERDLVTGVIQLANLLTRRLAPLFGAARITPQQWGVLSQLASAGEPMSLAALARRMLVSKQNMTGMIARLEQLELAERKDDPDDLRSSRLHLTRRGRALVEKLRPAYDAWHEQLTAAAPRETANLARTIDRLIAQLESQE
jgi:DNA-binding MarR family transcriptional regulator